MIGILTYIIWFNHTPDHQPPDDCSRQDGHYRIKIQTEKLVVSAGPLTGPSRIFLSLLIVMGFLCISHVGYPRYGQAKIAKLSLRVEDESLTVTIRTSQNDLVFCKVYLCMLCFMFHEERSVIFSYCNKQCIKMEPHTWVTFEDPCPEKSFFT